MYTATHCPAVWTAEGSTASQLQLRTSFHNSALLECSALSNLVTRHTRLHVYGVKLDHRKGMHGIAGGWCDIGVSAAPGYCKQTRRKYTGGGVID